MCKIFIGLPQGMFHLNTQKSAFNFFKVSHHDQPLQVDAFYFEILQAVENIKILFFVLIVKF